MKFNFDIDIGYPYTCIGIQHYTGDLAAPSPATSHHGINNSSPKLLPSSAPSAVVFPCLVCNTTTNEYQSIQCEGQCKEWFHTECIPLTGKQVKDLRDKKLVCSACTQPQRVDLGDTAPIDDTPLTSSTEPQAGSSTTSHCPKCEMIVTSRSDDDSIECDGPCASWFHTNRSALECLSESSRS